MKKIKDCKEETDRRICCYSRSLCSIPGLKLVYSPTLSSELGSIDHFGPVAKSEAVSAIIFLQEETLLKRITGNKVSVRILYKRSNKCSWKRSE
ncbi:hypothetical protein BD408DRAFT_423126 [Parasitella parasitica]|nr:hypothetical protein BD408DRAFT_423126 [Parasitella parasitica]